MYRLAAIFALLASPLVAQDVSYDAFEQLPFANEERREPSASLEDQLELQHADFMDSVSLSNEACDHFSCTCPTAGNDDFLWTVKGGVVALRRQDAPNGVNQYDTALGPYVSITRHSDWFDWEAIYYGVDGWDSTTPLAATVFQTSRLYNIETNIKRKWTECFTLLSGFRWIDLDERRSFSIPGNVNVDNNLFGFQLGVEGVLWSGNRLSVEATYKFGVFHNNFKRSIIAGPGLFNTGGKTSFANDVLLEIAYQHSDHLAFRCGYQFLSVNNIVQVANNETAIVQGMHAVIELRR